MNNNVNHQDKMIGGDGLMETQIETHINDIFMTLQKRCGGYK